MPVTSMSLQEVARKLDKATIISISKQSGSLFPGANSLEMVVATPEGKQFVVIFAGQASVGTSGNILVTSCNQTISISELEVTKLT